MTPFQDLFCRLKTINTFPWLFYAGLALMLINTNSLWFIDGISDTFLVFCKNIVRVGKFLLYLRLLLMFPRHPRYVFCFLILQLFLTITYASSGDNTLNYLFLVVFASRDTDIRITLRIYFSILIVMLLFAFVLYNIGLTEDITRHRWGFIGHSWGTNNPGTLAARLLILTMLGILLAKVSRLIVVSSVCLAMSVVVFLLTFRLTESISLLLLPLFYYIFQRYYFWSRWLVLLPITCLLLSVALSYYYPIGYGATTFESRFSIPHMILEREGLNLFGQDCGLVGLRSAWKYNIPPLALDNAYIRLFLRYGVLMGSFVMLVQTFLYYRLSQIRNPLLVAYATIMVIVGTMEAWVFGIYDFVLLYVFFNFRYFPSRWSRCAPWVAAMTAVAALCILYLPWHKKDSYACPNGIIGDIEPPEGFVRIEGHDVHYTEFVRRLPLGQTESSLLHFDCTPNDSLQPYCYRTISLPLLSREEQCADVCMRLRAEYLLSNHKFFHICFTDNQRHKLRYFYGNNPAAMHRYLKKVFKHCNTESMCKSMPMRKLTDIQPGDVFVYDAKSRQSAQYGHAMFVADVAVNPLTAQISLLLIEGSTPATTIHLVHNVAHPEISPWFIIENDTILKNQLQNATSVQTLPTIDFGVARYYPSEIRYFE